MTRKHNFNAGPAALPQSVLETAQKDFLNFRNSGLSIIEHSHRGKYYDDVHQETIQLFREIYSLSSFKILFLQGGASLQFAMLPMNLLRKNESEKIIDLGRAVSALFNAALEEIEQRRSEITDQTVH